jgi:transposase
LLEPYALKGARTVLRGGAAPRGAPLTRLGLDLADPGFDASVLVEFRARLVAGGVEQRLLDALLVLCRARGWLRAGARQRTDSTHVLSASRAVHRVGCARQALRNALNALAVAAPDWLVS